MPRPGRPPVTNPASRKITFRLTEREWFDWERAARGVAMSKWLRQIVGGSIRQAHEVDGKPLPLTHTPDKPTTN
jgi:hypothetical protein